MGIQVVIKADTAKAIELVLGDVAHQCEIFPIEGNYFGLSIPTKIVQALGEDGAKAKLALLEHFDLWEGVWRRPKTKWKFW